MQSLQRFCNHHCFLEFLSPLHINKDHSETRLPGISFNSHSIILTSAIIFLIFQFSKSLFILVLCSCFPRILIIILLIILFSLLSFFLKFYWLGVFCLSFSVFHIGGFLKCLVISCSPFRFKSDPLKELVEKSTYG